MGEGKLIVDLYLGGNYTMENSICARPIFMIVDLTLALLGSIRRSQRTQTQWASGCSTQCSTPSSWSASSWSWPSSWLCSTSTAATRWDRPRVYSVMWNILNIADRIPGNCVRSIHSVWQVIISVVLQPTFLSKRSVMLHPPEQAPSLECYILMLCVILVHSRMAHPVLADDALLVQLHVPGVSVHPWNCL